jgi:hypothetical protein
MPDFIPYLSTLSMKRLKLWNCAIVCTTPSALKLLYTPFLRI